MSKKSARIAKRIESCQHARHDPHYAGYFECFNRDLFFEAHEVLEELWLAEKTQANGSFYKGLIQLAGAFVHLQKKRLRPAAALFKLARTNLQKYPSPHLDLDVMAVVATIDDWLARLETARFEINPLELGRPPELRLEGATQS